MSDAYSRLTGLPGMGATLWGVSFLVRKEHSKYKRDNWKRADTMDGGDGGDGGGKDEVRDHWCVFLPRIIYPFSGNCPSISL